MSNLIRKPLEVENSKYYTLEILKLRVKLWIKRKNTLKLPKTLRYSGFMKIVKLEKRLEKLKHKKILSEIRSEFKRLQLLQDIRMEFENLKKPKTLKAEFDLNYLGIRKITEKQKIFLCGLRLKHYKLYVEKWL